ncbi:MAG TPA: hypothetical protein P5163_00665 [Rubrivivax sp.]|nr:hypothetical protein [Rubrivivax sp.]
MLDLLELDLSDVQAGANRAPDLPELRPLLSKAERELLANTPEPDWTLVALSYLLETLQRHGNRPLAEHRHALLALLCGFTNQAFGVITKRLAYPLPTGMGKTQAIVAWCRAMFEAGHFSQGQMSIAVSAAKVEALCTLKRDLIAAGIPSEYVGLMHSYKHDPRGRNAKALLTGYASEPCDPNASARPILLAAHNRIRAGVVERFNRYLGQPRDLLIWDESLMSTHSRGYTLKDLQFLIDLFRRHLSKDGAAVALLKGAMTTLEAERARRTQGYPPQTLQLSGDIAVAQAELRALVNVRALPFVHEAAELLSDFFDMTALPFVLQDTGQGSGLITFIPTVPAELSSIAILDASYPIRELCQLDKSIEMAAGTASDLKRFDNVALHVIDAHSGRHSLEEDLAGEGKWARFVTDTLRSLPEDESVIVFTFRPKSGRRVDCVGRLKDALLAAGVDPDQRDRHGRRRLVFLTWGQETSISQYSYCQNVIFAGVLRRNHLELAASICGQSDDLLAAPDNERIQAIEESEMAHAIYQAVSRGSCRIIEDGYARPMKVWLPVKEERVIELLQSAMPGMVIERIASEHLTRRGLAAQLAVEVATFLRGLDASTNRVTSAKLKKSVVRLSSASKDVSADAIQQGAKQAGWVRLLRTVARLEGH